MKQTKKQAPQSIFEVTFDIARRLEREAEEAAVVERVRQVRETIERQEQLKKLRAEIRQAGLSTQGIQFDFVEIGGKGMTVRTFPAIIYSHMTGKAHLVACLRIQFLAIGARPKR